MGLCPKPCIGNFPQEVSYEPSRTLTKEIFDSCTNLNHFYPVAGAEATALAAGIRSTANSYIRISTNKRG